MESLSAWGPTAVALAIAIIVFATLARSNPQATVGGAAGQIQEAAEVAVNLVAGAEQLWKTGHLPKDDRFDWVFDRMQRQFPDLDLDIVEAFIESGVYALKQMPIVEKLEPILTQTETTMLDDNGKPTSEARHRFLQRDTAA